MAADVAAYIQNNALFIAESAGDPGGQNGVQIMEVAAGTMRVTGLQTDDGGVSSVNGHTSQDFSGIDSLFVNLAGGNDLVDVGDLSNHASTSHLDSVYIDVDGTNKSNAYGFDYDKVTVETWSPPASSISAPASGTTSLPWRTRSSVTTIWITSTSIQGRFDAINLDNVDVKGNL